MYRWLLYKSKTASLSIPLYTHNLCIRTNMCDCVIVCVVPVVTGALASDDPPGKLYTSVGGSSLVTLEGVGVRMGVADSIYTCQAVAPNSKGTSQQELNVTVLGKRWVNEHCIHHCAG